MVEKLLNGRANVTNSMDQIHVLIQQLEKEMKRLEMWSNEHRERPKKLGAFGSPSMTFEEWLQFVFVPSVKEAVRTGSFPKRSQVAVAAIRNFNGMKDVEHLTDILGDIDDLVESLSRRMPKNATKKKGRS